MESRHNKKEQKAVVDGRHYGQLYSKSRAKFGAGVMAYQLLQLCVGTGLGHVPHHFNTLPTWRPPGIPPLSYVSNSNILVSRQPDANTMGHIHHFLCKRLFFFLLLEQSKSYFLFYTYISAVIIARNKILVFNLQLFLTL